MTKTKQDYFENELELSIKKAEAQYSIIVKPAQEKVKETERKARLTLEEITKPLYDNYPKEVYFNSDYQILDKDPVREQYQVVIDRAETAFRMALNNAMADYYKIQKPATRDKYAAVTFARRQYNDAIKELRKVDDWFEFRRTYQRSAQKSRLPADIVSAPKEKGNILFYIKSLNILCRLGFHKWSANRNGIRICRRCPAVDRYYGITGLLRYKEETDTKIKANEAELRVWWLSNTQIGPGTHKKD